MTEKLTDKLKIERPTPQNVRAGDFVLFNYVNTCTRCIHWTNRVVSTVKYGIVCEDCNSNLELIDYNHAFVFKPSTGKFLLGSVYDFIDQRDRDKLRSSQIEVPVPENVEAKDIVIFMKQAILINDRIGKEYSNFGHIKVGEILSVLPKEFVFHWDAKLYRTVYKKSLIFKPSKQTFLLGDEYADERKFTLRRCISDWQRSSQNEQ